MATLNDLQKYQEMILRAQTQTQTSTATPDLGQYVVGPAYNWQTYTGTVTTPVGPWQTVPERFWGAEVVVDRDESQVQDVIKKFKERIYESDMERKW